MFAARKYRKKKSTFMQKIKGLVMEDWLGLLCVLSALLFISIILAQHLLTLLVLLLTLKSGKEKYFDV